MPPTPAPLTRRLIAALETHAREDSGPVALADWPALSSLFDRELSLLTRLAAAAEEEGAGQDEELRARAQLLRQRYDRRARQLGDATRALQQERTALATTRRHARAAATAYSRS